MKRIRRVMFFFAVLLVFAGCASVDRKIFFRPETQSGQPANEEDSETWEFIESQNGNAAAVLPVWVNSFLDGGAEKIETLSTYQGNYVFVAENRGTNFNALRQWAEQFTTTQDLPRLVAVRIERRLLAGASLYPDDEYGEYFETFVKAASNAEYSGAQKKETFWIKRRNTTADGETEFAETRQAAEAYDFLILITVNKFLIQSEIRGIMSKVKAGVSPARSQTASINRIQQKFFEGF